MKDAVRLVVYFVTVVVLGALLAPILFWAAQWLTAHDIFPFLARFDFETFFHRALLLAAVLLIWPLFRAIKVRQLSDLDLQPNPRRWRHLFGGFLSAIVPLFCCGLILVTTQVYSIRLHIAWSTLGAILLTAVVVPAIEESFFRGLVLGILLRSRRQYLSIGITSALFAIVHFLKAPERTSAIVTWTSGFRSVAHSFAQFSEPMLVLTGFTTLFLIGWILGDTRVRTRSLWVSIGLHAGWILGNGVFNKIARRQIMLLPWLGKNLLIGIIPLGVICLTWIIVRLWLGRQRDGKT
ncbi:MAG: protease family protein [Verrucomicrobiota bacterium]